MLVIVHADGISDKSQIDNGCVCSARSYLLGAVFSCYMQRIVGWSLYQGLPSAKVVCLSIFPRKGISFVVIHVFRHERIRKYRDLETPTHRRLVVILAGVIFALDSEINIDGDSMFTNNSATIMGGQTVRGTCI